MREETTGSMSSNWLAGVTRDRACPGKTTATISVGVLAAHLRGSLTVLDLDPAGSPAMLAGFVGTGYEPVIIDVPPSAVTGWQGDHRDRAARPSAPQHSAVRLPGPVPAGVAAEYRKIVDELTGVADTNPA